MKLTMTIEISDKLAKTVSENSIERVINQTLSILEDTDPAHPYQSVNESDWMCCKNTVIDLWVRLQDAIFRVHNKLPPQE
jgi:hypothetical protein